MEGIDDMAESDKEKREKTKSFFVRLGSTIVLIGLGGGALYAGGWFLTLILMLISLCGVFELLRLFQLHQSSMGVAAYLFVVLYDIILKFQWEDYILPLYILYLLVLLTIFVLQFPKYEVKEVACTFFSFFYVAVSLGYIYQIRQLGNGMLAALVLLCACGNDMFAYMVGILIGKHKMFPRLSPKKSVEGFIGGILGAALCGYIFGFVFQHSAAYGIHNYPALFAVICGIGALPAVVGDLAASAIKRKHDIKDFSQIIPGHGGILDRFDSMIFTAPIIYYLVTFLLRSYL